jgi:hypothetical protein
MSEVGGSRRLPGIHHFGDGLCHSPAADVGRLHTTITR